MECNQPRFRFELVPLYPFLTTITITPLTALRTAIAVLFQFLTWCGMVNIVRLWLMSPYVVIAHGRLFLSDLSLLKLLLFRTSKSLSVDSRQPTICTVLFVMESQQYKWQRLGLRCRTSGWSSRSLYSPRGQGLERSNLLKQSDDNKKTKWQILFFLVVKRIE